MAKNNNNNNNGAKAAVKGEAPKKKRSVGRWFKELFSELKKVTWPTFLTVVKQTGVVLLVTLVFLLVLMGMDALLGWLYKLLVSGLTAESLSPLTAFMGGLPSHIPLLGGLL